MGCEDAPGKKRESLKWGFCSENAGGVGKVDSLDRSGYLVALDQGKPGLWAEDLLEASEQGWQEMSFRSLTPLTSWGKKQ